MKDIEKIIADLQAWVEEDKENRAIALVAVQKTEDKEKSYSCEKHAIRREAMTGLIKIADRLLKKSDKKSENSSEEGKEADHE